MKINGFPVYNDFSSNEYLVLMKLLPNPLHKFLSSCIKLPSSFFLACEAAPRFRGDGHGPDPASPRGETLPQGACDHAPEGLWQPGAGEEGGPAQRRTA